MQREVASIEQAREHAWCLQLLQSHAFAFYQDEVSRLITVAQRNVSAEDELNRDFQAGRLSALIDAQQFVSKRYAKLKPIVEVVPE